MIIPVNLDEKYDVIVENGALDDAENTLTLTERFWFLPTTECPKCTPKKSQKMRNPRCRDT